MKLAIGVLAVSAFATALSGVGSFSHGHSIFKRKGRNIQCYEIYGSLDAVDTGRPITSIEELRKRSNNIKSALAVLGILSLAPSRAKSAGYEAAPSAFSPMKYLYSVPLLPQSALLNSLPIENELVAELQAYLESFEQLINPSSTQENQIEKNDSVLWTNLRINAQRAAGSLFNDI
jgi:hypothetical protein